MSLQDPHILSMVGLGTYQDAPLSSLQPKLKDAIHLRWGFRPDLGFPWHGFYLFRRNSPEKSRKCLSRRMLSMEPETMNVTDWDTGIGRVSSDELLVLRDDFPPTGRVELDLSKREYLEFLPLQISHSVELSIGLYSDENERTHSDIYVTVSAFFNDVEVARVVLTGHPGTVASATLSADAIDRVYIAGAPASLIELCWSSVFDNATLGWKPVEGLHQPITLPCSHPDYPACGAQPTNLPASRTDALARVSYGDPNDWQAIFTDIHEQCLHLVSAGPAVPMADDSRRISYPVITDPGDSSAPPENSGQHPLQLLLLAALHAPIAQILGLYWSDTKVTTGQSYDYLIVADRLGNAGHEVSKILSQIGSEGFINLDGFIVFNKCLEPAVPLNPPHDVRCYALPGTTREGLNNEVVDASCNAGLRWELPMSGNILLPGSAIFYHLWRADYGIAEPGATADLTKFQPITKAEPILLTQNMLSMFGVQRPPDWPPFPLYGFDNGLAEGWYSYRASNIDIFGRHSALSGDGRWFEWTPVPVPRPLYYTDPPGNVAIHPFAISLLDKLPPPPPTGLEAYALDPDDPFVQKDAAYNSWFASLSASEKTSVIGLRARWMWTDAHARQAPDTKEFRIYYQGGRLNTLLGQTGSVTAASATETSVPTTIPNTNPAGTFAGCSLKMGSHMFKIVDSNSGSPLVLRVKNIGPLKDIVPQSLANCEVNIPDTHNLFVNYGSASVWEERYFVVDYNQHVTMDTDAGGKPLRRYEIILPAAGDPYRAGLSLLPDLAEPVKFGAIAVTAADKRVHTPDDPKWVAGRWGNRTGNESLASSPAIIFRVLRAKPLPPAAPGPDGDKIFASRADYQAASFYTYRWRPMPHLKLHVYRAMDDTIFNVDWSYRPRTAVNGNDAGIFPDEAVEPRWNLAKRLQVSSELNALNTFPITATGKQQALIYYRGLSIDSLRVLANLPNNETAFVQVTLSPLDPSDQRTANRVGPDNPADSVIDPSLRIYIDRLDGRSTNRHFYRACYVDGANNRSQLCESGPPIWLPNVVAPKSPTFTKVLAGSANPADPGDNKITLRWASNREADLAEYRIYRSYLEENSRSIKSMSLVQVENAPIGDPMSRPAENIWTDSGLPAVTWIYYRMTAVDTEGNESPPCNAIKARAFDESLPEVPPVTIGWLAIPPDKARAEWTAVTETQLERKGALGLIWDNATDWLPPGTHTIDDGVSEQQPWKYRLRARKSTGAMALGPIINLPRK